MVDLDLGGSNLHTLLGLKNPGTGLHEFMNKSISDLAQAVVPTRIPNLFVITSMDCSMEIANLFHTQKQKIIRAVQKLPYEYILLDLGAGTNFNTLDFFLISNEGVFVVTPEPTSIENTFRFIKATYLRKIKQILGQAHFRDITREALDFSGEKYFRSPSDVIDMVQSHDRNKGERLREELGAFSLKFIINQCRRCTDTGLGDKIQKVCNKHFYSTFQFLDNIDYDERVHDAVSARRVFIDTYPHTPTAVALKNISEKITSNGNAAFFN